MAVTFRLNFDLIAPQRYGVAHNPWPVNDANNVNGYSLQGTCNDSYLEVHDGDYGHQAPGFDDEIVSPREGNRFGRFRCVYTDDWAFRGGECSQRARTQLRKNPNISPPNGNMSPNTEYWMGLSMYLPMSMVAENNGRDALTEIRGAEWDGPSGPSGFKMWLNGQTPGKYGMKVTWRNGGSSQFYSEDYLDDRGKWVDWAFRFIWSESSSGIIEAYKNKVKVAERTGPNIMFEDDFNIASPSTPRLYEPPWRHGEPDNHVREVFYGGLRLWEGPNGLDEVSPDTASDSDVTAVDDSYEADSDTVLNVSAPGVLNNDNGNDLSASLVTDVSHGILTLNSDGSFSYDPNGTAEISDSFTYQASDGTSTDNATVSITINQVATGGSLSHTVSEATSNENLTNYENWSYLGYNLDTPEVHKSGAANKLATQFSSNADPQEAASRDDYIHFSWSDGDTIKGQSNYNALYRLHAIGNKFTFQLPAGTAERTASIWLVISSTLSATWRASLSDNSATDLSESLTGPGSGEFTMYKIDLTYTAGLDGAHLNFEYEVDEAPEGGRISGFVVATNFTAPDPNNPPEIAAFNDVIVRKS